MVKYPRAPFFVKSFRVFVGALVTLLDSANILIGKGTVVVIFNEILEILEEAT